MTTPNTLQVQVKDPVIQFGTLTAANTVKDGTGSVLTVFTAGTNNARFDGINVKAKGTNTDTVLRVFLNNGSDATVAANNVLFREKTIAATTLSEVAETTNTFVDFGGLGLPSGYKINVTIGTAVAAGLAVSGVGGSF
jgi:hypothetical protein